ncbi:MAG: hypothetical protein H7301_00865 [Cryobacterium sp.]|nr:hypothetical protein [Oligoflexia bacterium]
MNLSPLKLKLWTTTVLSFLIGASPALAESINLTEFNGNQAVVVGEGFTSTAARSFQVNIEVNGSFIADINTANGAFSYTTPSGTVKNGDVLGVKVLNWTGSGGHYVRQFNLRSSSPPPKPDFSMTDSQLREYANQQSRTVANRVVNTFGKLERWKYNFVVGYWMGISGYPVYPGTSEYRDGSTYGTGEGRSRGFSDGSSIGNSAAMTSGSTAARDRFYAIVNTNQEPDLSVPHAQRPAFNGLSVPATSCEATKTEVGSLDSQLESELRMLSWSDGSLVVSYGSYSNLYDLRLSSIYESSSNSYSYSFVDSWSRSDYAWSEWLNNHLGGGYDANNYNKLSASQQATFRSYFSQIYDSVIDEKYTRVRTSVEPLALARGQWYGLTIARKKNFDQGCLDGFNRIYGNASIQGFNSGFTQAVFSSSFRSSANGYMNNPVLLFDGVKIVDENRNGVFELGEAVGIFVAKEANVGRVDARSIPISLVGQGLDRMASSASVSVPRSSSREVNQIAPGLARVRMDVIADQSNAVQVYIGKSLVANLTYAVSWKSAIQALATARASDSSTATLKNFVLKNISDEYTKAEAAENDLYSFKSPQRSKLRDLVSFYATLKPVEREVIRSMGPTLVAMQETHSKNYWKTGKLRKNFKALASQIQ